MCRRDRNGGRPCALADEIGRPRLTDDHDGELDTLLDLVTPASSGERHDGESVGWDARETSWTTATAFSSWNTKASWVVGQFKLRLAGARLCGPFLFGARGSFHSVTQPESTSLRTCSPLRPLPSQPAHEERLRCILPGTLLHLRPMHLHS